MFKNEKIVVLKTNMCGKKWNLEKYERRNENSSTVYGYFINEPLCTVSNIWFCLLGIARLYEIQYLHTGYCLMILAGICSAYHHATTPRWTIIIDWTPISMSIFWILYNNILITASASTYIKIISAFLFLFEDHFIQKIPVPWCHAFWHILAAWSIDSLYFESLL